VTVSRELATAFVEGYGRTWGDWDFDGFVDLFTDDVVYVEHPVNETVIGREAMGRYIRREHAEAGTVRVRMGKPFANTFPNSRDIRVHSRVGASESGCPAVRSLIRPFQLGGAFFRRELEHVRYALDDQVCEPVRANRS
jgi:hypothetical protein